MSLKKAIFTNTHSRGRFPQEQNKGGHIEQGMKCSGMIVLGIMAAEMKDSEKGGVF